MTQMQDFRKVQNQVLSQDKGAIWSLNNAFNDQMAPLSLDAGLNRHL